MLHLLHMFPFLPKAMLFTSKSITPRLPKHCFQTVRTMLLASKSNAPGLRKQCFGRYGAMLWWLQSYVLYGTELCSVWYGAMFCMERSNALYSLEQCSRWTHALSPLMKRFVPTKSPLHNTTDGQGACFAKTYLFVLRKK